MNKGMLTLVGLLLICSTAFSQSKPAADQAQPAKPMEELTHAEQLFLKAHSVYVDSKSHYMKQEQLEKALLAIPEFQKWGFELTRDQKHADLTIEVQRAAFQNSFPYSVTERSTQTVVDAGQVNSLGGTVFDKIAKNFITRVRALRTKASMRD